MKDIYVVFKGGDIAGESTDTEHAKDKAIEVSSWKHEILQPKSSTASTAGGHSAERTEHGEMIFTKEVDAASAKLWQACSAGSVTIRDHLFRPRIGRAERPTKARTTRQLSEMN